MATILTDPHDAAAGDETALTPLELEVAQLLVTTLRLEDAPDTIAPDEALFGDGLGLDSIDALELALAISRTYGFEIKSDDADNRRVFASLRALADHIQRRRAR
ncbi:MAG: acyl carrier protein [Proteobacteria bacterium]|nr:acyl carrier protein [Pseudomonadota bacterium]